MRLATLTWILSASILLGAACSSSGGGSRDAGAGGAGGAGNGGAGPGTDGSASDADAGAWTCQQVRICASTCTSDSCVSDCKQRGGAGALAAFQTVTSCTQGSAADGGGGCPPIGDPGYYNCLCLAQCLQDPPCAATLDPCLGAVSIDLVCVACN